LNKYRYQPDKKKLETDVDIMSMTSLRSNLKDNPLVVFTADQDWAPEWACQIFVDEIIRHEIPCHIFRTNSSNTIDNAISDGVLTCGWHPNFKPYSTHGTSISEVIATMKTIAPESRTIRAHSYFESSETWDYLYNAGQLVESHGVTVMEENLFPVRMASKLVRVPVFFEDDVFMRDYPKNLDTTLLKQRLLTPGLKVFDFHPIHLGLNSMSLQHYESLKDYAANGDLVGQSSAHRGIRDVLEEIVDYVRARNLQILSFEDLVNQILAT
jgi:hypothetical protein